MNIILIFLHFDGDLHYLNICKKYFLFGKVVGPGWKIMYSMRHFHVAH